MNVISKRKKGLDMTINCTPNYSIIQGMSDDKIQKAASASLELEIGFNGSRYTEKATDNPFHKPISCNIGEEYEKDLAALGGKTKVFTRCCILKNPDPIKMIFYVSFV